MEYTHENLPAKPAQWFGARHLQMLLLFILITIGYGMRVNLSVGIVAMTDPTVNPHFPTYDWTIKSTILSSFFWGYIIPQVGAGQLAERFGAKWLLTGSMAICALFTALIPPMAELGAYGVLIARVVQGFCQGFFYPCMHYMLSKWTPITERSRLGSFIYAGGPFGIVIAMPVTGWLSASSWGWPSVFYIYGGLGLAWVGLWVWLGSNSPSDHKTVSDEEKRYIIKLSGQSTDDKRIPTPWKAIFTSWPLWSILIASCGQAWGYWTLLTEIPTYMNSILHFDIADNGLLSAAPYFTLWMLSFVFSFLSDYGINKNLVSVGVARKTVTTIGLVSPAIVLVILGILDTGMKERAIALLIVAVGLNSAIFCGHQMNHVDIAPTHAGTLIGITNGGSHIFAIIAPLLVEFIVTEETDPNQWKIVFFLSSGAYAVSAVIYAVFASGERQYWDQEERPKKISVVDVEVARQRKISALKIS